MQQIGDAEAAVGKLGTAESSGNNSERIGSYEKVDGDLSSHNLTERRHVTNNELLLISGKEHEGNKSVGCASSGS
jgi:hypothetical protein